MSELASSFEWTAREMQEMDAQHGEGGWGLFIVVECELTNQGWATILKGCKAN